MPLSDFAQNNKGNTLTPTKNGGSLSNFAGTKGAGGVPIKSSMMKDLVGDDTSTLPRNVDEARKLQSENPSLWSKISKQLMKPIGVVATLAEETGRVIGDVAYGVQSGDMSSIKDALENTKNIPGKVGGILTGTRQRSFTDVFSENWDAVKIGDGEASEKTMVNFWNDGVPQIFGLITDIAADPLNFVGGGLTNKGKLAEKATKLKLAGDTIKADSKLAAQIKALGLTDDMLKIGKTKAEQVAKGQRALLTVFANTRWEKSLAGGTRIYDMFDNLAAGIKQTKASKMVADVFSTKTSDEGFNKVKEHFTNLLEYKKGKVMDEAMSLQNDLAQLSPEEARRVIDVIETGVQSGDDIIDTAAKRLDLNFKDIRKTEEGLGLLKTDIENYFPHQLVKTGAKDSRSAWAKFKDFFVKADGTIDDMEEGASKFGDAKVWSTKLDSSLSRNYEGTIQQIRDNFGITFDDRPAIVYAKRALGSAKATTSKEFFNSVKDFALKEGENISGVETKVKDLKGLKFPADIAKQIDEYYEAVKPASLSKALKSFDSVQNWWKAQALTAPSYHVRNFVGNMWNNFLGGVVDPKDYYQAGMVQNGKMINFTDDAGRVWDTKTITEAAKRSGVINEGWYAKDIDMALSSELGGASWNPLKQNFGLFKANRAAGSVLENNARLAHFISKLKGGATLDDAAISVKKFLFDYGDLTSTEKNLFKRVVPFYTWTRKNIPLQLGQLVKQPAKFAAIPKVTNMIENNVEKPNEKYLGDYIKDNVGIRVGNDKEGNTMYFLLGSWLPAAQAIDFLSQPTENLVTSVSPFLKTPIELWANQSTFFEDTFGQPSKIERYPEENQSYLGLTMRKKTAYILKNIRILNELDKLNPGSIFGDKDSPSLINRVAPEAGFRLPLGIGTITTSEKRGGRFTPDGTTGDRILQSMFGKTSLYNPSYAKKFYLWDTETKIRELERAAKDAQRDGQKEYAKRLREELKEVKKSR